MLPRVNDLSPEEELKFERNIVWLFGSRRSGTTWLGKQLLSYHTEYVHEPNVTVHLAIPQSAGSSRFVRSIDQRKHLDGYFFSDKYKNTWKYHLGKLLLYRLYAQVQDLSKPIIVKEPSTELNASDIIVECMPNSKMIILLRDGRDIIDSMADSRREGGWALKEPRGILTPTRRAEFIENRAKTWVTQMEIVMQSYQNHDENLRFLVRYEDLRIDTLGLVQEIYRFLNIEISEDEVNKLVDTHSYERIPSTEKGEGKFVRFATPGKWEENFNAGEKALMGGIMGEMLQRLGYQT